MSGQEEGEREHEATAQKLARAREKGDVVRSPELAIAACYAGFLAAALALGGAALSRFGTYAQVFLDAPDRLAADFPGGGTRLFAAAAGHFGAAVAPWFLGPAVAVLLVLVAQRGVVFAPEKLLPKASRINPIANAGQKFGRAGLFEFLKSVVKLAVISIILGWFLSTRVEEIVQTQLLAPGAAVARMLDLLLGFLLLVTLVSVTLAGIDYLWQRFEFLRRNRMSRKELLDEMKQSEGDPHVKSQRRQKAMEIATRQMISDVAKADVVIVNPTHYAVALKWEREKRRAPVCLAKGTDEIAARIREVAMAEGIPVHADPTTARALHACLEIGAEVPVEHFRAVAAAIRFAQEMRRRMRQRRGY